MAKLDEKTHRALLGFQRSEITEHAVYMKLAGISKNQQNSETLRRIAEQERGHYEFWKSHTNKEVSPNKFKAFFYISTARLLGLTFGVKLMERGEIQAQAAYAKIAKVIPEARKILEDEKEHELDILRILKDSFLHYVSSIVLGLNDALVELTGALAGFTFALQKPSLIATAGIITGISASLSMAASEYLSTKSEEGTRNPLKSAIYTGIAYILVVLLLITPYVLFSSVYAALAGTLITALIIIIAFSFYISVAREISFKTRFLEMALLSFGVAVITFTIGYFVRKTIGIEV